MSPRRGNRTVSTASARREAREWRGVSGRAALGAALNQICCGQVKFRCDCGNNCLRVSPGIHIGVPPRGGSVVGHLLDVPPMHRPVQEQLVPAARTDLCRGGRRGDRKERYAVLLGRASVAVRRYDPEIGGGPLVKITGQHQHWVVGEFLRRDPQRGGLTRPRRLVPPIVAVTRHITVWRLVVLKGSRQAWAGDGLQLQ